MPFIAHGSYPNFLPKQFCCLMINKKWKLHHYEDGIWKRIPTGLPEDTTECSPTAEYDPINEKWRLSYIAGGHEADRSFKLYLIDDLANPSPNEICHADVGFIFKSRIVYGGRAGNIFISDSNGDMAMKFLDAEYLYRISYNPNSPNEFIISGQTYDGGLFSRICNPFKKELYELKVDGNVAYKAALFNGNCYYAYRGESEGFEDRRIVKAETFSITKLSYDLILEIDI